MADGFLIDDVKGLLALDSRGTPTVKAIVRTRGGGIGYGIAPSGASKSSKEAVELRDGGRRWNGKGVSRALGLIDTEVRPRLVGVDSRRQDLVDNTLIALDGTGNKSRLGGNTTTAVSIAVAKAAAATAGIPLFQYLGGPARRLLPVPVLNVINGGAHAGNELDFQEFMIIPMGADSFSEALRMAVEVYWSLKGYLKEKYGASAINVGDEGGFAPPMRSVEEALEALERAIDRSGYALGTDFYLGIDAAANHFYTDGTYRVSGRSYSRDELIDLYVDLALRYRLAYIEDPFQEDDFEGYSILTRKIGYKTLIVGDDLYATNTRLLEKGIEAKATNAALVKVNQVGTLTETLEYVYKAQQAGMKTIISHRSGDTEDPFIADLAVATGSGIIKTGAPARGERTSKYNRLLEIEEELGPTAAYKSFI